jgi:uncharacterized protein
MEPEFYIDVAGQWRWRMRAGNGRVVADSGEGYRNLADCQHGLELIREWGWQTRPCVVSQQTNKLLTPALQGAPRDPLDLYLEVVHGHRGLLP